MQKIEKYAKIIDHALLQPALTDKELINGCELAKHYNTASVCVKPYAIKSAVDVLEGTNVKVGTVVGFPHGNSAIEVKEFETEQAIIDGASEIDMVINIGKALSNDLNYVEKEVKAIFNTTKKYRKTLKVILETGLISDKTLKIKLCDICSQNNVDYVKTSTGFAFKKDNNNQYFNYGANDDDIELLIKYSACHVKVKASGGINSFEDFKRIQSMGVSRIGTSATKIILEKALKLS